MAKKAKRIELPLVTPLYSTYHSQGNATAILAENPSIRNWYLNEAIQLECKRKFLSGFTSPEIDIQNSSWTACPQLEKVYIPARFLRGYIHPIIREMLEQGYYVVFDGVDDFYVKGKTWYQERHFEHDGLICGYDQEAKSYCIYAYDKEWRYQTFWTPQKAFEKGKISIEKSGMNCYVYAVKPKPEKIAFSSLSVCRGLQHYLYAENESSSQRVTGSIVHAYIAEYVERLYNGSIPYERMDRRVFRLIWEHKKAMLERLLLLEEEWQLSEKHSAPYQHLVAEANTMRMLYATHHMKRKDSVLPLIRQKLLNLMRQEREILTSLVYVVEKEIGYETMEFFERKNANKLASENL